MVSCVRSPALENRNLIRANACWAGAGNRDFRLIPVLRKRLADSRAFFELRGNFFFNFGQFIHFGDDFLDSFLGNHDHAVDVSQNDVSLPDDAPRS